MSVEPGVRLDDPNTSQMALEQVPSAQPPSHTSLDEKSSTKLNRFPSKVLLEVSWPCFTSQDFTRGMIERKPNKLGQSFLNVNSLNLVQICKRTSGHLRGLHANIMEEYEAETFLDPSRTSKVVQDSSTEFITSVKGLDDKSKLLRVLKANWQRGFPLLYTTGHYDDP